MNASDIHAAAMTLADSKSSGQALTGLPAHCVPGDFDDAYAIQEAIGKLRDARSVGWKIAATSLAGQRHIGVTGPLAGRLFDDQLLPSGSSVSLDKTLMHVIEPEFAFKMRTALPPRAAPYTREEIADAVDYMCPTIEVPNSRYRKFEQAGALQLLADTACSHVFLVGAPAKTDWRSADLPAAAASVDVNGVEVGTGCGANVLGDPWIAFVWLVNELSAHGRGIDAGDLISTGACVTPVPVKAGDDVIAKFGPFGEVRVRIV